MIKSDNPNKSSDREPCWGREVSSLVRFELEDGSWLMLPYAALDYAWLPPPVTAAEVLELHFTTHRVRLQGTGLRKLASAVQKHAVEWVRPALKTERLSRGEGPTWITSIAIEENQRAEPAPG